MADEIEPTTQDFEDARRFVDEWNIDLLDLGILTHVLMELGYGRNEKTAHLLEAMAAFIRLPILEHPDMKTERLKKKGNN